MSDPDAGSRTAAATATVAYGQSEEALLQRALAISIKAPGASNRSATRSNFTNMTDEEQIAFAM